MNNRTAAMPRVMAWWLAMACHLYTGVDIKEQNIHNQYILHSKFDQPMAW